MPAAPSAAAAARKGHACTACRTAKIKCDGNAPCMGCAIRGKQELCFYPPPSELQGRPSKSLLKELKSRIQELEGEVNALRRRVGATTTPLAGDAPTQAAVTQLLSGKAPAQSTATPQTGRQSQGQAQSPDARSQAPHSRSTSNSDSPSSPFDDEEDLFESMTTLTAAIRTICINDSATASPNQQADEQRVAESRPHEAPRGFVGSRSDVSILANVAKALQSFESDLPPHFDFSRAMIETRPPPFRPQFRITLDQLYWPAPPLQRELVGIYFERVHPLFPILDVSAGELLAQLATAEQRLHDVAWLHLALGILMVAARFHPVLSASLAADGVSSAGLQWWIVRAQLGAQELPTDGSVIALQNLLLSNYFALTAFSDVNTGFQALGAAMRLLVEMGAHREAVVKSLPLPDSQKEHIRRLFWVALVTERENVIGLGRPAYLMDAFDTAMPTTGSPFWLASLRFAKIGFSTTTLEDRQAVHEEWRREAAPLLQIAETSVSLQVQQTALTMFLHGSRMDAYLDEIRRLPQVHADSPALAASIESAEAINSTLSDLLTRGDPFANMTVVLRCWGFAASCSAIALKFHPHDPVFGQMLRCIGSAVRMLHAVSARHNIAARAAAAAGRVEQLLAAAQRRPAVVEKTDIPLLDDTMLWQSIFSDLFEFDSGPAPV